MKRRTIDASKFRRPIKRSRITDSVNGSWLMYLRAFIIWLLIITMDFTLEFRFEFLWPFWLLIKSSFDSFKYQGLGLTLLFLCFTLFSDIICFLLLPTHWLFFVASTYVWVQFICNTERGPCVSTVCLWLLFVYVEASVRLREIKSVPFNLDLCRPFAAHCIGFPVVTLGYGFKSYLGYRIKTYQRGEVEEQNKFYQQLVAYALPTDTNEEEKKTLALTNGVSKTDNNDNACESRKRKDQSNGSLSLNDLGVVSRDSTTTTSSNSSSNKKIFEVSSDSSFCRVKPAKERNNSRSKAKKSVDSEHELSDNSETSSTGSNARHESSPKSKTSNKQQDHLSNRVKEEQNLRRKADHQVSQLEGELRRVRSEMTRQSQTNAGLTNERNITLDQLTFDNDLLQQKINSLNSMKSQEKLLISSLERKLRTERENRLIAEGNLFELQKKSEEQKVCEKMFADLENEVKKLNAKLAETMSTLSEVKKENESLKRDNKNEGESGKVKQDLEFLKSAFNALQGKNLHLENSLSSETRLKLDLFSALGDARRNLEIVQGQLKMKSVEVDSLKAKIAEVMAVMPQQMNGYTNGYDTATSSASYTLTTTPKWLDAKPAPKPEVVE